METKELASVSVPGPREPGERRRTTPRHRPVRGVWRRRARLLNAVLRSKDRVPVYPVNPNHAEVMGVPAFRSV